MSLTTADLPEGFSRAESTPLKKEEAVGSDIEAARPILNRVFESGVRSRWKATTSDTIYELLYQLSSTEAATSYFEAARSGPKATGSLDDLPNSQTYEGEGPSGSHWVSVIFVLGPYVSVIQYSSHGAVDPRAMAHQLSLVEARKLDQ